MTRTPPPVPEEVWRNPLYFIAFGFGTGAIPFAPGTFGTLIAIPFYLLLRPLPAYLYIVIVAILTAASIWLCDRVTREIKYHDHQGMNLDEIIGFLVTMTFAPTHWIWIIIGFGLFRFFDIVKPWPIQVIDEKTSGGLGVILDDVIAGLFSCAVLQILVWISSRI